FREADTDSQRAISFGWIEVDQLRSVNERFGPHVGDLLVQAMGQLIGNVLRTERGADLGCRVLGNGFAAFLGDTGSHHGVFAVERIRQTVAQSTWLVDHKPLEVSVSCGVIEVLAEDALPELITRSRAACRYARSAGGNQTWL